GGRRIAGSQSVPNASASHAALPMCKKAPSAAAPLCLSSHPFLIESAIGSPPVPLIVSRSQVGSDDNDGGGRIRNGEGKPPRMPRLEGRRGVFVAWCRLPTSHRSLIPRAYTGLWPCPVIHSA